MKRKFYFLVFVILVAFIIKIFVFSSKNSKDEYQKEFNSSYKIFALNLPNEIFFCEEPAPLDQQDIVERLDREMLVNTYWQSQTILFFKKANRWFPVIEPILKENGIPEDFKYLPLIESSLQNKTSPSGAVGFWQFLKTTGNLYGLEINNEVDERYHVEKSTRAACKYLKNAHKVFGNWTLAAASYNMGVSGVKNQLKRQKVASYYDLLLNIETSRYIFRLLAVKEIMTNPKKYGFHYLNSQLYPPLNTYIVSIDTSVKNFADFASEFNITYKTLKNHNPWLRQSHLKNKNRKTYDIKIPILDSSVSELNNSDTLIQRKITDFYLDSLGFGIEDSMVIHKVRRGENIFKIAKDYQVKVAQILQWNNLGDYYLKRGQRIKIYLESSKEK